MGGKSFRDALNEARTDDGQATIYYASEDGTRAAYDVPDANVGEMYLNGRLITRGDVPEGVPVADGLSPDTYIYSKSMRTAEVIFSHNNVNVESGWKTTP